MGWRSWCWGALLLAGCSRTAQEMPGTLVPDATVMVDVSEPDAPATEAGSDAELATFCQQCVGTACRALADCRECPATRHVGGAVCPTEGFSCYYPPRCAGSLCTCRPGGDGKLRWNCMLELCRR